MTTATKVRKTLSLDAEVVERLGSRDVENLSAVVNEILRAECERREYHDGLVAVDRALTAQFGEPDPALVAQFEAALA